MPVQEQERPETRPAQQQRRLPIGAEVTSEGVSFRVWAPKRQRVAVVLEDSKQAHELQRESEGYFSGIVPTARAGSLYRFRLDDENQLFPDPASRYQPQGPNGPSQVVDPAAFQWTDSKWQGITAAGQVLYEMHIGTFTKEGTWQAAMRELKQLAELGITCLEVMPVNEFAGRWGWGYDGVDLFAPFHHYGTPDDFRRFVDAAHAAGIGVILDLVYNHMGPDGNYLRQYSEDYFNAEHMTDWGEALNFDGKNNAPVREFFVTNAVHWISEYHLDGFRFDATQAILDSSGEHVLAVINRRSREAAGGKSLYLINENEPQNTRLVRPSEQGGYGLDALWNDDFHHAAMVAVTGHDEAYYTDYCGSPQEFISSAKWGYLFQGQRYKWQKKRRGTPAMDLLPTAFVHFLQNHDQIANSGRGERLHQISSPAEFRAISALLLLMPQTPMLFQGQEFGSSSTFHYFHDHNPELKKLIGAGRAKELAQFPSVATESMQSCLIEPGDEDTFLRSKIDHSERQKPKHAEIYRLHKDLLKLRRGEHTFRRVQRRGDMDGAVLGPGAFVLRYFANTAAAATPAGGLPVGGPDANEAAGQDDRLVIVNLGSDLELSPAPEPLLAPPLGCRWVILLSTEEPQYGGSGSPPPDTELEGWLIRGRCTMVLKPLPAEKSAVQTRFRVAGSDQGAKRREDIERK